MKKNFVGLIIALAFLCSNCKEKENNILFTTTSNFKISDKLSNVLSEYIKENKCDSCINELYFDKKNPHRTIITISSRPYSDYYFSNVKPLMYLKYNNIDFYIYNGTEDYLIGDISLMKNDTLHYLKHCPLIYWSVVDSFNHVEIIKNGGFPFMPLPHKLLSQPR